MAITELTAASVRLDLLRELGERGRCPHCKQIGFHCRNKKGRVVFYTPDGVEHITCCPSLAPPEEPEQN